jgi:hypothetical protein
MVNSIAGGTACAPSRLRARNPVSLLCSGTPWASAAYLVSSLFFGTAAFVVSLVTLLVGGVLAITWIGIPLLIAAFALVQALAAAERGRAAIVGTSIGAPRRRPRGQGMRANLVARLRDGASWRDVVALVVLWPYLFVLDLVALVVWLICWALISLPFWYRYIPEDFDNATSGHGVVLGWYPDGPHGSRRYGFYIGDLHTALGAAGIGVLLLVLVGNYLVLASARTHVASVGRLLDGR